MTAIQLFIYKNKKAGLDIFYYIPVLRQGVRLCNILFGGYKRIALNIKQQFFRNSREINFTQSNIKNNKRKRIAKEEIKKNAPQLAQHNEPKIKPTPQPSSPYQCDTYHYTTYHIPKRIQQIKTRSKPTPSRSTP